MTHIWLTTVGSTEVCHQGNLFNASQSGYKEVSPGQHANSDQHQVKSYLNAKLGAVG